VRGSASKVRAKTIRWLVPNVFALGQLTIIDGDPGLGKSLLMLDLAARLSTGRSWPAGAAAAEPAPVGATFQMPESAGQGTE